MADVVEARTACCTRRYITHIEAILVALCYSWRPWIREVARNIKIGSGCRDCVRGCVRGRGDLMHAIQSFSRSDTRSGVVRIRKWDGFIVRARPMVSLDVGLLPSNWCKKLCFEVVK